ncbi:hypothetical protein CC78DRAFT_576918 [Lojkania enalia]|uniref:Rhodopsin domain-containing protein n=1 Tax=Lojkania enalia TaxID=147567 RepID=A0A9P4KIV3_9PLEO|nr:hypothetical protein CC78DRAFT_576918 [Didymosphaeria enalia]
MPPTSPSSEVNLPPAMLDIILNGPALQPPVGAIPHLDGHWDEKYKFYIVISLCMAIMAIFILVRIYTKLRVVGGFEPADYFIIASYAISLNVLVFSTLALPHGWGVHQWNVQVKTLFKLLYYINILEILYGPLVFCIKMAVTLQYLRMFVPNRTVNPFVFYGSWSIITACTIFYIVTTFLTVYACNPREKIWDKLMLGGHCLNYRGIIVSTACFNILSDVAILLLPVTTVWKLRIPTKKKIAISLLFGTGLLACGASAMRVFFSLRIIVARDKADISYNSVFTALWSYIECALGVIVACSISIPKLLQAKGGKLRKAFSSVANRFPSLSLRRRTKPTGEQLPVIHEARFASEELKGWESDVLLLICPDTLQDLDSANHQKASKEVPKLKREAGFGSPQKSGDEEKRRLLEDDSSNQGIREDKNIEAIMKRATNALHREIRDMPEDPKLTDGREILVKDRHNVYLRPGAISKFIKE